MSQDETSPRSPATPAVVWLLFALILLASLLARVPILASASLNSDEAVNALTLKHLIEQGELTLYNWDASYYGIVEGLIALPFVVLLGFEALAFKLAALVGLWLLMVTVFLLGRSLYGNAEALAATALLAVFSPQVLQWSTLASGGYLLVVGWGALTLLQLGDLRRAPGPWKTAALGFTVGFGLYVYELYVIYLALLAGSGLLASSWWVALWRGLRGASVFDGWRVRETLARAALFGAGFGVGWSPKMAVTFGDKVGSKVPAYGLADLELITNNLSLLVSRCLPALLGVNPAGNAELTTTNGPSGPVIGLLGVLLALALFASWHLALMRQRQPLRRAALLQPVVLPIEALLVLLVPINLAAFTLSRNPVGALANRYLLPVLPAIALFGGVLIILALRSRRWLGIVVAVLLMGLPAFQSLQWLRAQGLLTERFLLDRVRPPMTQVLHFLDQRGIRGGYASYWYSYSTTFLSKERVIVAPYRDWDRYPAYTRQVGLLENPAYVFHRDEPHRSQFLSELDSARAFEATEIGPFVIYTSADGQRLLPAAVGPPVILARPRADLELLAPVVSEVVAGTELAVPLRLTNRSDGRFSAGGIGLGTYRVAVAYRWRDDTGAMVVSSGKRTLLPRDVEIGESAEVVASVEVPMAVGRHELALTLVQESVAWFDDATASEVRASMLIVAR